MGRIYYNIREGRATLLIKSKVEESLPDFYKKQLTGKGKNAKMKGGK